jgi:hypothetical protein
MLIAFRSSIGKSVKLSWISIRRPPVREVAPIIADYNSSLVQSMWRFKKMSDDKSDFQAEAWLLFYWLGLEHTATIGQSMTESIVHVGEGPAPGAHNRMIAGSRLEALEEIGLVEQRMSSEGLVYVTSEKGQKKFNEIISPFCRKAREIFINEVPIEYKKIK